MTLRLAITQPYLPAYRLPLWNGVIESLRESQIEARLFFGGDAEQMGARNRRGDGVNAPWAEQVAARTIRLSRRLPKMMYRQLPREWAGVPLLTEMQATNGNAWECKFRKRPFVTLGHGKEYTSAGGTFSARLESAVNRSASHVLTYLPSGRDEVIRRTGLDPSRVTSFNNSTDTRGLRRALLSVTTSDQISFRERYGIPSGARVAFYLGAMNAHKRIDILAEAARRVFASNSDWWLVAVGEGPDADLFRQLAADTGRVTVLGQLSPTQFAPAARIADVLLNPGRIGLVAVDALAMGLPILTTRFDRHAPEAEYLVEGDNMHTADADADSFARLWLQSASRATVQSAEIPNIEASVDLIASALKRVVLTQ